MRMCQRLEALLFTRKKALQVKQADLRDMIEKAFKSVCTSTIAVFLDLLSPTATSSAINPYPTAFPYRNGMVLHFYQQQESSTTKTVHKVINRGLKTYVRKFIIIFHIFG